MNLLLFILAAILVIAGVMSILRKEVLWGVVLIVVGLLVGPGGASIFT
ncbi:MAG TPA: GPGG-motif small membrane protein [Acidimicrobiales bacterium]